MSYTLNKTDGSIFASVGDGTINTDLGGSNGITIIGKNYAGYGEFLGENFLRLLENGSNIIAPANPLQGQVWFDSIAGILKVYNGAVFKNLGSATADSTAPLSPVKGDLWFDTSVDQLKVYDGTDFILVGSSSSATGTSGAIVDVILDNIAGEHVVVMTYAFDDIISIESKDAEFTPAVAIPGFITIKPGINLASTVNGNVPLLQGTATNSELLGGELPSTYLKSDQNDATTGSLAINNDTGLTVGADNDAEISVSGINVIIGNTNQDGDIFLRVNDGGVTTDVITLGGAQGRASVLIPLTANNIANKDYVDTAVTGASTDGLQRDGSNEIAGTILPDTDITHNFGSALKRFDTIHADTFAGRATTAQYADLAERFEADAAMVPGTVVQLGGSKEITEAQEELTDEVFGVISTSAGFLMNSEAGTEETHPSVAMSGRVPVRVVGKINKGNRLVSAGNGLARAATAEEATSFNVIGRALESKTTTGEGVIEAIVTVN